MHAASACLMLKMKSKIKKRFSSLRKEYSISQEEKYIRGELLKHFLAGYFIVKIVLFIFSSSSL
jgi:hypothetical protein